MRAFEVKQGAPAYAVKVGESWNSDMRKFSTSADNLFFVEELRIDPTGIAKHCSVPSNAVTIGGQLARDGFYGFCREGWYLIVHAAYVKVL